MNISQGNSEALKNPWVLGLLLFLAIFLTANGIFIYLAFTSPPNLVVKDFYERGETYEQTQKQINEEKGLGWSGIIMTPAIMHVHRAQIYEVLLHGRKSAGLDLDLVTMHAYRPSNSKDDFSVEMTKEIIGVYRGSFSFKLPGIWDLIAEARLGEQAFLVTKRIIISP